MYLKFSDVKCNTVDEKMLQFRYISHNTVSVEIVFEQKYYNFQTFCCSSVRIGPRVPNLLLSLIISLHSAAVTIGFDATAYTFTETDSTVSRSVTVSVQSGSLARDVVVTVQTMDGTATGGSLIHRHCKCVIHVLSFLPPASSDYTTVSMDLTFNAGTTNQTVMIPIADDTVVESTESFTVSLMSVDSVVTLNPSTTSVTIQDDDSKISLCTVQMF